MKMQVTAEGFPHTKHHADDRGFPHFYPKTYVLRRGDVAQKLGEAAPGVLRVLTAAGNDIASWKVEPRPQRRPSTSYRRAALAAWLTDTEYGAGPLAARVIVNRLWQHHFGQGIVATPNDFGAQGSRPSHPELLDWLAHGADRERLAAQADPSTDRDQCRLHARQPVRRVARGHRPRERLPLAAHAAPTRGRADPRRDAGGGRTTRLGGCSARAHSTRTCRAVASISSSSGAGSSR